MRKLNLVFSVGLICLLANPLNAQSETQNKDEKKPKQNLDMAVEMTTTIMAKMFEKAEPDDEQRKKIKEILDSNVKELVYSRQTLQEFFTSEQQATYNAAIKQARKAKYDTEKAHEYALRKLKLSEEKLAEYNSVKSKADGVYGKINSAISAILSDEQKAKIPNLLPAKKEKKNDGQDAGMGSGNKNSDNGSGDKSPMDGSGDKKSDTGSGDKGGR